MLADFKPHRKPGGFEFARMQRELSEILGAPVDFNTRKTIQKAVLKEALSQGETIHAS